MLRRQIVLDTYGTVAVPIVDEVVASAKSMGFTPGNLDAQQAHAVSAANNLDGADPTYLLYGQDFSNAVVELQEAAQTGRLAGNMDVLRQRDLLLDARTGGTPTSRSKSAFAYATNLISNTWATGRTMAASGMLAGGFYAGVIHLGEGDDGGVPVVLPAPNTRYMGMNLLTAPLIALTTVGARGSLRALSGPGLRSQSRDVARQMRAIAGRPLVDAVSPRPPSSVIFTTDTGRQWTFGELRSALERNNVQTTRGQVEFTEAFTRDLKRDAGVLSSGAPAGQLRQFLRNFDPRRTNLPQYVANATDRVFRENTFASALRAGMPEEQAAALARAVVLDYGEVPDTVKQVANRYILFVAFRFAMYTEALRHLARDPDTFNRLVLTQRNLQQSGSQWALGPDHAKSRMPVDLAEYVYDGEAGAMIYGPVIPQVDAVKDFTNMAAFVAQLGAADNDPGRRAGEAIVAENLVPALSNVIESAFEGRKGIDSGFKVPDVMVAYSVENGMWPMFRDRYRVVPVMDPKKRTPGRPTYKGQEWRFDTEADMRRFKRDMVALTYMGMRRSIEDWTKAGMTYDPAEFLDPKRRALPHTLQFITGWSTPITTRSPEELESRALSEATRAAQTAGKIAAPDR